MASRTEQQGEPAADGTKPAGFARRVTSALLWRSGSQAAAQLVSWAATFLVIRMLEPDDYGLFAMTQVMLVFLNLLNGYGFASALVQAERIDRQRVAQVFGILLLLNGALALAQLALAPVAAAYFRQPDLIALMRVQALLYLATPFIALPNALLSRSIEFRRQAIVNLVAALASAATALACAAAGLGVWTLIWAPMVLFWLRAVGMTFASPWLVWPSFRFRGAGAMLRYGSFMMIIQSFWFVQSQADVFIAGRLLDPHRLGLYTTALFLTQILAAKFVPPVNEVAFAAYARIQGGGEEVSEPFLRAVRLVMLIGFPFYLGLAVTAGPLVATVLGSKWIEAAPLVQILALAMPFLTLQILFAPATNAIGRPEIALRCAAAGAVIMPAAFLVGISHGTQGLAIAWLAGFPLLTFITAAWSLPALGVAPTRLLAAVRPGFLAASAMALAVLGVDALLPPLGDPARLGILAASGAASYALFLLVFARASIADLRLVLRPAPAGEAAV